MKANLKVADVMERRYISVKPDTSLLKCVKTMKAKKTGFLVVEENNILKGIITESDIVRSLASKKDVNIDAKHIMNRKVIGIHPGRDVADALSVMNKTGVKWLPAISKGRIVGLLGIKEVIKIQPTLVDLIIEKTRATLSKPKRIQSEENLWKEGACAECGAFDILSRIGERYVCGVCSESIDE
ncbi:MAG: CBS domain-containing protein [archaeon]